MQSPWTGATGTGLDSQRLCLMLISASGRAAQPLRLTRVARRCPCCLKPAPAQVDLDEMEFERGIGGAALANDVDRLRRLLAKGRDPDEARRRMREDLLYEVSLFSKAPGGRVTGCGKT